MSKGDKFWYWIASTDLFWFFAVRFYPHLRRDGARTEYLLILKQEFEEISK